ncbi:MAG TPA: hypothetical protein VG816_15220 [Solirubrobacterales bacterium]|nr:hypothetical protein [Solirubrobacterales bacterium]
MAVCAGIFSIALMAMLWAASNARASEGLYWDNYGADPDNVAFANVDGSGGGFLNLGTGKLDSPEGMDYDSASNRLFVANEEGASGEILAINLNGSGAAPFTAPGAPIEEPEGVAVYPPTNTIYWENTDPETISWAKLDGSAGGVLNLTGAPVAGPCCRITVDPVGKRVYWVNSGASPNTIGYANLDNTGGGGELNLAGSTVEPGGEGLAVDDTTGRLYFLGGGKIGYANLNGTGGGDVSQGSAIVNSPWGLAIDPSISRLYWGNEGNSEGEGANAFGFTGASSGVGGNISIANALIDEPQDPVIIKSPSGTGAPAVTRDSKTRSLLACSQGSWAADFYGAFVYQAPRSYAYQWTRNGTAIAGATATSYPAQSAGSYACTVTATNQTGSASQGSAAVKVNAAKVKLTVKKKVTVKAGGVAKFKVKAVNQGDLQTKKAKVCVKVPKKAKANLKASKCKTLGKLKGRGKKGGPLTIKLSKEAKGTYQVKFVLKGAPGKSAKAKITVK